MKKKRFPLIFLLISVFLIVLGYFLWTILIPIQDIDLMSKAELLTLQKEVALNYELGRIMMLIGMIGSLTSVVLIARIQFRKVIRGKQRNRKKGIYVWIIRNL